MKTPREILLQQHQAAAPKLDALRLGALAGLSRPPARQLLSWREWLWPCPRAWAGLAAVWLAILGLNLAAGSGPSRPSTAVLASSRQQWIELNQQQEMLAKLLCPPANLEAEPPKPANPRHSGIVKTLIVV